MVLDDLPRSAARIADVFDLEDRRSTDRPGRKAVCCFGMSVYLDLTREFNEGGLKAVLSSGQAVVMHRLAVMSKDGDWILREDPESLQGILRVLERHGARYRFGAPPSTCAGWPEAGAATSSSVLTRFAFGRTS